MKFKAIIGQIIEEKDYKKYGFIRYHNCDYLNLQEKGYFEESKKKRYKYNTYIFLGLLILAAILGGIFSLIFKIKSDYAVWTLIVLVIFIIIIITLWNIPRHKDYWYFDSPFPVKKPHNYKVNDEVEINVEVMLLR